MGSKAFLAALAAGFTTVATAQAIAEPAGQDATDAQAPVAPLVHQSPFARYRPFTDASVGPWRGLNEEVARIGGWKTYAREAYEASLEAAAAEKAKPSSPAPERATKPR